MAYKHSFGRVVQYAMACVCGLWMACAQAQPAANPMDVVPEKMPFDIPYGAPMGLDRAGQVLDAALAESKKRNWKLICAVVDPSGFLITMRRMDQAQIASIDIAIHKARTASKFRRETKALENAIQSYPYIATLDDVIASRGGVPLVENGMLIGSIGCSGGTGSQDEVVAKAGAALVNK
jgi:glc operon protein GlcG